MYTQLIALLLPAIAIAAPAPAYVAPVRQGNDVSYTATFEDRNANPVTPLGNNVGTYAGLNYANFGLFQQALQGQGLIPNTIPNTAVWGSITGTLLGGTNGRLTANFDGSTVQSFDLKSLYFGCSVATQESTVNLPASCTVTFTAKDKKGSKLAAKSVKFGGSNQMQFVQFGSQFARVYEVEFAVQGALASQLVVGATDTLKYTVHVSK